MSVVRTRGRHWLCCREAWELPECRAAPRKLLQCLSCFGWLPCVTSDVQLLPQVKGRWSEEETTFGYDFW